MADARGLPGGWRGQAMSIMRQLEVNRRILTPQVRQIRTKDGSEWGCFHPGYEIARQHAPASSDGLARNAAAGSWRVLDTGTPVCRAGGQDDMRMILVELSERAAADRRKCCAVTPARREPIQPLSWHYPVQSTTPYFRYKNSLVAVDI